MILEINRNPVGVCQWGITGNKIIHPTEGEKIEDSYGIETYKFNDKFSRVSSIRLNDKGNIISYDIYKPSSTYVLYHRKDDVDIPLYVVSIIRAFKEPYASIYPVEDKTIILKDYSYTVKRFINRNVEAISDSQFYIYIPKGLSRDEYRYLFGIIQLDLIKNYLGVKERVYHFSVDGRYYCYIKDNLFYTYGIVNILSYKFKVKGFCIQRNPDKIFDGIACYVGDRHLFYIFTDSRKNSIRNILSEYGTVSDDQFPIKQCEYACIKDEFIKENMENEFVSDFVYANENIYDVLEQKGLIEKYKDMIVSKEDAYNLFCIYGVDRFCKKYNLESASVKQLLEINSKEYQDRIRLAIAFKIIKTLISE